MSPLREQPRQVFRWATGAGGSMPSAAFFAIRPDESPLLVSFEMQF
jgi:hypothetical protein